MQIAYLATATLVAAMAVSMAHAMPLSEYRWKNRVLVISAPVGDGAAKEQRRIYQAASKGMSERQIVLAEALDDSQRSMQIRSEVSASGGRFQVFLVGKDGHTALSSDKPLSADYLFARVDAMPMRQDEMRRGR
jgi:Domain of unknown function (DUF4174)